jgi:hypothetical protein
MTITNQEKEMLIEMLRDARTFYGGQKHNASKALGMHIRNEELINIYQQDALRAQQRIDWANQMLSKLETI